MSGFKKGQRVRTTVDAPAAWEGAFSAPKWSRGTVVGVPNQHTGLYAVLLDDEPDRIPTAYWDTELTEDDE